MAQQNTLITLLTIVWVVYGIPVGQLHCPINRASWGIGWNWEQIAKDIENYNRTRAMELHSTLTSHTVEDDDSHIAVNCSGTKTHGCNYTAIEGDITVNITLPVNFMDTHSTVLIGKNVCFFNPTKSQQENYVVDKEPNLITSETWGYQMIGKIMLFWPKTDGCFHNGDGLLLSHFNGIWLDRPRDWENRNLLTHHLGAIPTLKLGWKSGAKENLTTVQGVKGGKCQYFVNTTSALDDFMIGRSGLSLAWAKECYCLSIKAPGYWSMPHELVAGDISPTITGPCRVTSLEENLEQWSGKRMGSISWAIYYELESNFIGTKIKTEKINGKRRSKTMVAWYFNYPDTNWQGIFQKQTVLPYYFEDYPSLNSAAGPVWGSMQTRIYNTTNKTPSEGHWGSRGRGAWTPIMGAWVGHNQYTHERINLRTAADAAAQLRSDMWTLTKEYFT